MKPKADSTLHLFLGLMILSTVLAVANSMRGNSLGHKKEHGELNSGLLSGKSRFARSLDSQSSSESLQRQQDNMGINEITEAAEDKDEYSPRLTEQEWLSKSPELHRMLRSITLFPRPNNLARWYFPGLGYFARGGRASSSNFIRFGRDGRFGATAGPTMVSGYATKKNNFIRLGRAGPGRNNFIRLGRSGHGSKVGFFPDYYSPAVIPNGKQFTHDLPTYLYGAEGQ